MTSSLFEHILEMAQEFVCDLAKLMFFISIVCVASCGVSKSTSSKSSYDIVIAGGRIIDGSGNPWFFGDVGIRNGKISAIGDLGNASTIETFDAQGKIVAPGFIDLHSHADDGDGTTNGLRSGDQRRRQAVNIVSQGSTTVVVNPDGVAEIGLTIRDQKDQMESRGLSLNVALMVGHNTIRAEIMGQDSDRLASPQEIAGMRSLLRDGMRQGAFGLTSGLEYPPGIWANEDELVKLAEELELFNGVHISHIRSETIAPMWWLPSQDDANPPQLLDAVSEIINIAERSRSKGVVSHMKVRGETHWGESTDVVALIEDARSRGVEIYGDQYPYNSSGSDGDIVFIPDWAIYGDVEIADDDSGDSIDYAAELSRSLSERENRTKIFRDIEHSISFRGGASNIVVFEYPDASYIGKNLLELAEDRGISASQMAIALQMEGFTNRPGGARLRSFSLQEADIENIMRQPWVATSSDGGVALPEDGPGVHARYYGTFPRKIAHYVRSRGAITLEQAIRSSTSLPAQILGIDERGLINVGMAADIVVFDYQNIQDMATFTAPHQYAKGIDYVLVNGVPVFVNGSRTAALPGLVLQHIN